MKLASRLVRALVVQRVPSVAVLLLCLWAFWLGTRQAAAPLGAQPVNTLQATDEGKIQVTQQRALREHAGLHTNHKASLQASPPASPSPLTVTKTQPQSDNAGTASVGVFNVEDLEQRVLNASGIGKAWPLLQPGKSGEAIVRAVPFQVLSWYPRIVLYPAFVDRKPHGHIKIIKQVRDKRRCEHVISMAMKSMYPSGLAWRPGEQARDNQDTRTSTGTFLSASMDKEGVLAWIEDRIAAVTRLPRNLGEPFNVLHYKHGQHYDSHMDSFDPQLYGSQVSQRIATVLVYLSDVVEGGDTIFKKEGIHGDKVQIRSYAGCADDVLKYKPRMGDAVLFYSVLPDQSIDPRSLHGGCPVLEGEKWVATKWIHDRDAYSR